MMELALKQAYLASQQGEIPVGCVIVQNNKIIAAAHNTCETNSNCTQHAEINAINSALAILNKKSLEDCDMYVTVEPCPMCAGAIINAKIKRLYIGAPEPKSGCFGSVSDFNMLSFNHKVEVYHGINEEESGQLMKDFFKDKR